MEIKDAILSPCKKYRYYLSRTWDAKKDILVFVMLNPSTADAEVDDPTIRRCIGFGKDNGYGGIIVLNLFAFRSSNPSDLIKVKDPEGPENLSFLDQVTNNKTIIAAWGEPKNKLIEEQAKKIQNKFKDSLFCLGKTKKGNPRHPLYLKKSQAIEKY